MPSPKQIIEEIRKISFGIGLEQEIKDLPEDIRAHIEAGRKFKDDAARLVNDLYTEKPHFILELIQNVEDNDYCENVRPKIKFIIQEKQLILQNNENGFTKENVEALCGIGKTTKRDRRLGYIGEKGIGFKSVFMVTNEPRIYSNGFQFKFNYDEKNPVSIITPEWVDMVPDFVKYAETNIVLPFKEQIKGDELINFIRIDPRILLFLRKLRFVEIENTIQDKSVTIKREDSEEKVEIVHSDGKDYWMIIKSPKPLKVPGNIKEDKRKDITETEIILAFPLNSNGSANFSNGQKVFVYLPVRSYGFKFIIQADFLLPPSREDIHKDKPWKEWLRDNIHSIFLQAVERFKQDKNLKKSYYNYIPLSNEVSDPFFLPVVEQIYNALSGTECVLTESENWQKPADVFLADDQIRKLISNDDLKSFFDKEYISSEIEAKQEILNTLGIQKFKLEHLLQCLQKSEWLEKQGDEWFITLYAYLNKQVLNEEYLNVLKKSSIVRLENGQLTSISKRSIFLPLDRKGDYSFEKELRVVKRALLEAKDKETKNAVEEFLKKLGVKSASSYEIIENHILPIYESENDETNWKSKDTKILLGYIRYIKDNLNDYEKESDKKLNTDKKSWEKKEDPLGQLRNSLYICINKTIDGSNYYEHPANIYLPRAYGIENNLETLFEGIKDVHFVHREYIEDIVKKYRQLKRKGKKKDLQKKREADIKEWKDFFVKLEVNTFLIIKKDPETELCQEPSYANNQVTKKEINKWEKENTPWKNYKWRATDWKYYIKDDWVSKDLDSIFQKLKDDEAKKIGNKLLLAFDKNWKECDRYTKCYYYYRYSGQQGWSNDETDSTFLITLKNTNWLPTTKGTFAKSSEVFLNKPEIKELLGDSVPYLDADIKNEGLIKTLGINADANIGGVLNYLKSLTIQKSEEKPIFTKLYEFLNKNYDLGSDLIKNVFSENQLIFIPETTQEYFTRREVLWKDVSDIFGENRGYLEKHYQKLKSFFVDKLGVSQKPIPKDYTNVLIDLSKKEEIDKEDEEIIIKIYKELNYHLDPENYEHLISEEDWWEDFIKQRIFWTDRNEFWKNDSDVFVNDNEELYTLFKDKPQLAFLKLPKNYHPKIQHFIKETALSYLSKTVATKLATKDIEITKEKSLTELIQKISPYILRYLYQIEHNTYEKLKGDGSLAQLKNLKCFSIKNLQVEYILKGQSVFNQRNALLYNGSLYIQSDHLGDTDHLAIEISKLFGNVRGLDSFLVSLFDKKTEDKIENLLRAKEIQELPEEECNWFGIVEPEKEVLIEERVKEPIVEVEPTRVPTSEFPPIPIPPGGSAVPEIMTGPLRVVGKKEWQPQCEPQEAEIHIEELQPPKPKDTEIPVVEKPTSKFPPLSPTSEEADKDILSNEAKKAIGRWGEEYAFECLKDKFCRKYPGGLIEEAEDGFIISFSGKIAVRVHWLNKIVDKMIAYDIKVVENSNEEYVEVKTTKTETKEWFEVSRAQWEFAQERGSSFHIYRVYNAGIKQQAKYTDIPNPVKLWQEEKINAYPIRIQV